MDGGRNSLEDPHAFANSLCIAEGAMHRLRIVLAAMIRVRQPHLESPQYEHDDAARNSSYALRDQFSDLCQLSSGQQFPLAVVGR